MNGHEFNFDGSEYLAKIGATWFVSYYYFKHQDKNHLNWENITTTRFRISVYNNNKNYHKYWMEQVLNMNDKLLNTNEIGLDASETKRMARELLATVTNWR